MFNSLRAIKQSAPIPRILLGSAIALVLALALWLVLIPVAPKDHVVVAAPNADPIAGLSVTNDGPKVVSDPISFTASVTQGAVATYTWDFGDGNNDSGASNGITHAYTESGVYTATVVAANDTNAQTATTTVYVGDAVVTVHNDSFTPKNVTIPLGGTVIWVHQDGTHSVTADDNSFEQPLGSTSDWALFSHTFNSEGTVLYHCSLHGSIGGVGMSGTVVVQGPTEPIEGLNAGNLSPATINTPIEFTTTITSGNNITYTWDFGDGVEQGPITDITTTHAYTAPGIYTATVTAVNISSTVTATTTAYVGNAVVEVKDNFYDPATVTIPPGGTVVWVLRGEHSHSVTADDNSFEQPAGNDWPPFVHTFPSIAATDAVSITYHCTVHPNMKGAVVIATPLTDLTADNDGPAQVLTPVHFTANITGGGDGSDVSYAWDFGDGGEGANITTTHTYAQSGAYTATVTATNGANTLTATTTVLVGDAIVHVTADSRFDPKNVEIPVGGTVIWVLTGGFHSVTADDGSFEQPAGGDWPPFAHTFNSPGTVPYHCSIHGAAGGVGMSGTVVVTNSQPQILLPQIDNNP